MTVVKALRWIQVHVKLHPVTSPVYIHVQQVCTCACAWARKPFVYMKASTCNTWKSDPMSTKAP